MTNCRQLLLGLALLFFIGVKPASAESFTIIAPYLGTEQNTYVNLPYGLEMKDSASMKGLYIQSIDLEKYQWNLFLYRSDDINSSDMSGFNFIYDHYIGSDETGKYVLGVGLNHLDINMAGSHVPTAMGTLDGFDMDLSITSLYLRFGRYYNIGQDPVRLTVLPWIGWETDRSSGTGLVDFPGPGSVGFSIDDDQLSWIAGVNFRLSLYHFIDIEVKHMVTRTNDTYYNKSTALFNFFVSRNLGLSYRYNTQETSSGRDSYGLWGVAYMF